MKENDIDGRKTAETGQCSQRCWLALFHVPLDDPQVRRNRAHLHSNAFRPPLSSHQRTHPLALHHAANIARLVHVEDHHR